MEIQKLLLEQREYYSSFETFDYNFRIKQLKLLKQSIKDNQNLLIEAFKKDLNKCEFDAVTTEISLVNNEINYMLKHLKSLMKPKKVYTSILNAPSYGKIINEPLGQILIMSPWNYPFQLTICPLVGSIAGGNTTIVKPSAYTPNVSDAIAKILSVFPNKYISVILGGREQNQTLLDQKFDLIFFTGSKPVGKVVQEKASKNLTPVILELGGKSPCIVSKECNIDIAAKRIVWGKYLNAGQTCIAPDYIFVHVDVYADFITKAIENIKKFYYNEDGTIKNEFMHIVNSKHVDRLNNLIDKNKVVFGGKSNGNLIEPTILKNITYDDAIMQEEIFGPIMPVIKYTQINEVIKYINNHDKPLALYYFGESKEANKILTYTSSGGACINDVIMHFTEKNLPFGGVGESGMNSYHGKKSFEVFTHAKSILVKSKKLEVNLKYPPYNKNKTNFVYKYLNYKK